MRVSAFSGRSLSPGPSTPFITTRTPPLRRKVSGLNQGHLDPRKISPAKQTQPTELPGRLEETTRNGAIDLPELQVECVCHIAVVMSLFISLAS